jgi:hypothetical protein
MVNQLRGYVRTKRQVGSNLRVVCFSHDTGRIIFAAVGSNAERPLSALTQTDTIKLSLLVRPSVEVMFFPPRHVCTVCRAVPAGNRQRAQVSRHQGAKTRSGPQAVVLLRRAGHCSVLSPVTPFYLVAFPPG